MTEAPATPEIDKLNAEAARHRVVGEFIDWLSEAGFTVCETIEQKPGAWGQNPYLPTRLTTEQMLAKFLEVDLNKVEDERRQYLDWHRDQQQYWAAKGQF